MPSDLTRLAAEQHGLLTLAQLDAADFDRAEVRRRVRRGEWHVIRQGVVAVQRLADRPGAAIQRIATAALLVLPPGSAVCGETAALLWRVVDCSTTVPVEVHVLLPPGTRHRHVTGVRLHAGPAAAVVMVDGVACTDLPRTLLDVCAAAPLGRAVTLLDAAERAHPGVLGTCRARAVALTGRGSVQVRRAARVATGACESPLESLAWVLWHTSGLPLPLVQAVIRIAGRFVARVDFLWPEAMLVVEVDGVAKYSQQGEAQREKARQNRLVAEGYVVLRFTWADVVHRPDAVLLQIRRALMINSSSSPSEWAGGAANSMS